MGQVHKKTKAFIEKNLEELLQKEVGLFLCCMEQGDKAKEQYELAFPEKLRDHAVANSLMGFEYLLEKMGFLEKIMVKKITGKDESFSKINEEAIQEFVSHFS
jgi:menaquinone-dependent protoporphyrinogen oxidase